MTPEEAAADAFVKLAEMHCRIVVDKKDQPFQWIYAVDDAWFHPANWKLQIKIKVGEKEMLSPAPPLFSDEWSGKTTEIDQQVLDEKVVAPAAQEGELDQPQVRAALAQPPQPGTRDALIPILNNSGHRDSYTAKKLATFIQERYREGLNYGLCFCSFEYLWENMEQIDQPQNAVFFDIRHALANPSNTLNGADLSQFAEKAWSAKLLETGIFADNTGDPLSSYDMKRLGWYLHYALKFGRIGANGSSRCEVQDNHIQIISSAINPGKIDDKEEQKGSKGGSHEVASQQPTSSGTRTPPVRPDGDPGVMSEYTIVQTEIWNAMLARKKDNESIDHITPDRFTFSPIPKAEALDTGLEIFNNSFRTAGKWDFVQRALFEDAESLWCHHGSCGHPNGDDTCKSLKCSDWWENCEEFRARFKDCFKFSATTNGRTVIKYKTIRRLLQRSLVHRHYNTFNVHDVGDDVCVTIPSNPAILWLAVFIDFLDKLAPENKDGKNRPKPSLHVITKDQSLCFALTLDETGVTELKGYYDDEHCSKKTGATPALLAVSKKCAEKLLDYSLASGKLIDQRRADCSCNFKANGGAEVLFPPETPDKVTIIIKLN